MTHVTYTQVMSHELSRVTRRKNVDGRDRCEFVTRLNFCKQRGVFICDTLIYDISHVYMSRTLMVVTGSCATMLP